MFVEKEVEEGRKEGEKERTEGVKGFGLGFEVGSHSGKSRGSWGGRTWRKELEVEGRWEEEEGDSSSESL